MFLEVGFGDEGAASYDDEVYDITKKPEFREQSVSTETDTLICEEIFELKKKIEVLERTNEELLYLQNKNNTSLANTKEREQQNEGNNNASSFFISLRDRSSWLVGLLVFQSCSSFILARNDALLQRHPVIVHFLTMLVGAGGNAGNQASVRVIRGLALKKLNTSNRRNVFLKREVEMALALCFLLSTAGFIRALLFRTPWAETVAITCSLGLIVFSSICLGAILPFVLKWMGFDPAHSSTTIQVVMDILGVIFTVQVSSIVLSRFHS